MTVESERLWHILIAAPGQEIKAGDALCARGFETFVPKIAQARRAGRSATRLVPRAMFPCYVFAEAPIDGQADMVIRETPGIQGFMMVEFNRYATLPVAAIDMIRFTEAEIENDRCRRFNRPPAFAVGQRVIIPKGRWSELSGKIKALHGDVAEVVLELALLGRSTARVAVSSMKAAS